MKNRITYPWKKILVPVDFSDRSRKALASAINIAKTTQAELTIG
jgi:nucleotide-binding universal stress UspA family protein